MIYYRDGLTINIDAKPKIKITRDGHVIEEYRVDGKKNFFATIAGTPFCAHGKTLEQAISDALWKDETKRPNMEQIRNEIREAGPKRLITKNEFRLLTGACSEGIRIALERAKRVEEPMTAKEILKISDSWGKQLYSVLGWKP
jgi:hypothetical protein